MRSSLAIPALALSLALGLAACKKQQAEAPAAEAPAEVKEYPVTGVVKGFQAEGKVIILAHDKIDGLMDAMTMGFELEDPAEGKAFKVGQKLGATLRVQGHSYKLGSLQKR